MVLQESPIPLISKSRKQIILWSAKAACTMTYVWYAIVSGFEDEIVGTWPHDHRTVYQQSPEYLELLKSDLSDFQVLKVIRDPYVRAASMYRHALRYGAAFADDAIENWSKGKLSFRKEGLSFQNFLDFLSSLNLPEADIHLRPQRHPCEATHPPRLVLNISERDLLSQINDLERQMKWSETDFSSRHWIRKLEAAHHSNGKAASDFDDRSQLVRTRGVIANFPPYEQLLTDEAKQKITSLYAVDFDAYRHHLGPTFVSGKSTSGVF
jgi:hypothetical protein